ncbi:MAG TPA: response regulator [Caulobacteraceae bacterium]|nr:response regulator [Caulobacteraceae bacterium]
MFNADAKTLQRIAAEMQRVLIVDAQPAGAKLLSELLRDICLCQIWTASDARRGLALAERTQPHVVFIEQCAGVSGVVFTRDLRRSDFGCRKAPVVLIAAEATASAILGARDAGVHEFLRKPYTIKDLMRRLEAVILRPRDWVEGVGYVGPDRRRFNSGDYSGPLKRRVDHAQTPAGARIVQALKILKAAIAAIEADPRQALRAMLAQVDELSRAATDPKLGAAALALGRRLRGADPAALRRADLEPLMSELWDYLPTAEAGRSAAA